MTRQGLDEWSQRTWDQGFDGHKKRQLRMGLGMSPLERLRWLENTMDEMRRLCGRAREASATQRGARP